MSTLLEIPYISQTRRNHALEHAAVHILSERFPGKAFGGHSNPTGFFIIGDVPTEQVGQACVEALSRLQAGERHLAIHEGCGTNFVVMGALAAFLAILGMVGTRNTRQRLERFPLLMFSSTAAFIAGRFFGPALQQSVTTDANVQALSLLDVSRISHNIHRVTTKNR